MKTEHYTPKRYVYTGRVPRSDGKLSQ